MIPLKITQASVHLSKHIPFHLGFGTSSAPQVPKLIYWVEVEKSGKKFQGCASEFAMVGWFDKGNNEASYLEAMSKASAHAVETVQNYYNGKGFEPFTAARDRGDEFRDMAASLGTTRLALQMIEALEGRAILDAVSKSYGNNAVDFLIQNQGFDLKKMDDTVSWVPMSAIFYPSDSAPSHFLFRHTVGLDDIIHKSDTKEGEQSLEGYIEKYGLTRFKVKIDNRIDRSIDRLCQMAEVIEKHVGDSYVFTLDGNEAFDKWDELLRFVDKFSNNPKLSKIKSNTSYIEQPFHRDNLKKIDTDGKAAIRKLKLKYKLPILIDESGDEHDSYKFAVQHGINGGGFKLCKGVYKAVFDAATALSLGKEYFNSAEDLTVAEPTDLPQALAFFSRMRTVPDAELNGAFKTESGIWLTDAEKNLAVSHMPSLFRLDNGNLKVIVSGNKYPTKDVSGLGFGSPVTCFDPKEDVPHLRKSIKFTS